MRVLLLFFCSGASALIYEVIWSKYLGLILGSTIQAQTIVLAVFMGGLALGNRLFGRRADLLRQPLAVYGYVEAAIGLYAFFFPQLYSAADKLFISLGSPLLDKTFSLLLLKGFLSAALLLIPTTLMGGTLPLLAGWLQKYSSEAGRLSARFYSINSLGAVFGAGLAGFVLVRQLGMVSSLQVTALLNVLVGIAAIALGKKEPPHPAENPASAARPPVKSSIRQAGLLVALTGGVSMGLEVLASRSLALVVGGSLYAFSLVLMGFICGIGIGGSCAASPRWSKGSTARAAILLLTAAAFLIGSFVATIQLWTALYAEVRNGLAPNPTGYVLHQFVVGLMAFALLGIPAALLGAVLPLTIRKLSEETGHLGENVGQLLTWNTAGAVTGVMVTGFFLMPQIGLRGSLSTLALVLAAAGLCFALKAKVRKLQSLCVSVLVGIALVAFLGGSAWRHILGSGIYRLRGVSLTSQRIRDRQKAIEILYYKDAPDATVAVERGSAGDDAPQTILRINGKADASTHGDLSTQYLLAHLPLLARPESQDIFVLGFGSGITGGALLGHPIRSLTIAENCAPVLEAAKFFEPWNRGVLANPKTRIRPEDARTVLKLSPNQYDVVISEPSNPWVAGIGGVFSKEFYELAASRLKPGGIMAQWFHIYEMHDGIVFLVLRTFNSVFPHMEVWDSETGDIILLGSKTPWESSPAAFQKVFERAEPRRDFEAIGIKTPLSLLPRQIASQQTAFAIAGPGPIQTDEFPTLEYSAPEAFYIGEMARDIFLYDERTFQSAFASPAKKKTLLLLPDPVLHPIFAEFSTSNELLARYLRWRAANVRNVQTHPVYDPEPFAPIIFRPPQSYPSQALIPAGASLIRSNLLQAEALILSRPAEALDAVGAIETALKSLPTKTALKSLDWSPAYFAALGAKTCWSQNQPDRAKAILRLGLDLAPLDRQLQYLDRLFTGQP